MKTTIISALIGLFMPLFSYAWPCDSCLILNGEILDRAKTEITVYQQDSTGEWLHMVTVEKKKRYSIHLDPETTYRMEFRNLNNDRKLVLYIHGGAPGYFHSVLDVNFIPSDVDVYHIKQENEYKYTVPAVGDGFNS